MCTVSIVPVEGGVRMVCNRDEARSRPRAVPPRESLIGRRRALFPVDPASGGTWTGLNDAGLACALLNRSPNSGHGSRPATSSRGSIIAPLLACERIDTAVEAALALRATAFEPFRLVILQGRSVGVVMNAEGLLRVHFFQVREPLLWTSSSLGDALVERPRAELFERMVLGASDGWARGQRRFHRHRWTRHPELSVVMSRTHARTVSRTTIDLLRDRYTVSYEPLDEQPLVVAHSLAGAA